MNLTEKQIIEKVDRFLQDYDRVIIIKKNSNSQNFISKLTGKIMEDDRDILIVTNDSSSEENCVNVVADAEIELYCKLYFTYEFSDRITVIADSDQYPNLFNYLAEDILTEDEVLGALLH